ncbi:MAG: hypothetical protein K0R73_87 [Candidatus Midichloriaceae bacterium]|jgi:hypothetical protein|nr:hypothetical protein [Candidatus Midichloriaceae bacterium]
MFQAMLSPKDTIKSKANIFDNMAFEVGGFTHKNLKLGTEADCIEEFIINTNDEALKSFSTYFADAYPVASKDQGNFSNQQFYALVFKNTLPIRLREIITLTSLKVDEIISPHTYGLTRITKLQNELRFVVIMQKPIGKSLELLMRSGIKFDENFVVKKLLKPLLFAINQLHKNGMFHGKINPKNIFIDEAGNIRLGEMVSECFGHSQPTFYETTELAQAHRFGKGLGNKSIDYYALGMTICSIIIGKFFGALDDTQTISEKLYRGSYEFIVKTGYTPKKISQLIKGLIIDNSSQRHGFAEITSMLEGKNDYQILVDKNFSTRAIIFNGKDYYSRKALAFAMYQNWTLAKEFIKTEKIKKWFQLSNSDEAFLESLNVAKYQIASGKIVDIKAFDPDDEALIRALILIDPEAPVRIYNTAFNKDGIGNLLAYCLEAGFPDLLNIITASIIVNVYISFEYIWELLENQDEIAELLPIYKCIDFMNKRGVGFGLERCLYELNPTLPCQSQIVKNYPCFDILDLVYKLEEYAVTFDELSSRKILICFISAKLENTSIYKIEGLENFEQIQRTNAFQITHMIALVQQKFGMGPLPNLAITLSTVLKETLDVHIKSKSIRKILEEKLDEAVKSGDIQSMLDSVACSDLLLQNATSYAKAVYRKSQITQELIRYSKRKDLEASLKQKTLQVVLQCSYIICSLILLNIILRSM